MQPKQSMTPLTSASEIEHYRVRLEILKSISTHLTSAMSVQEVIEKTLELIQNYFPAVRVSYSTIDSDGELTIVYATTPPGVPPITGLHMDLQQAPSYLTALRDHQPVIADDITRSDMLVPLVESLAQGGIAACLDIPLNHSDGSIGLLCFDAPTVHGWTDYEAATLTDVAEYLTVAIRLSKEEQERKQFEIALRESEERFRQIAESTSDLFWLFDARTERTIYLSPAFEEIFGYSREEGYGNKDLFFKTIYPEDKPQVDWLLETKMRGELQVEHRIVRPDGAIRWVRLRMFPIYDSSGEIYRYAGIVQDITDYKLIEAAEREQHVFAEALNETAEFLNSTLDVEEVFERILVGMEKVTPAADLANVWLVEYGLAQIVRYKAYTDIGRTWVNPDSRFSVRDYRNLFEAIQTRKAVVIADTLTYEGWVPFPANDTMRSNLVAPICLDGEVVGLLSLAGATPGIFKPSHAERLETFASQASTAIRNARLYWEISQHAQELEVRVAERTMELRLLNNRLQVILDSTGEGICYSENRRVQYANRAFTDLVGWSERELQESPTPLLELLSRNDLEAAAYREALDNARKNGNVNWRATPRLRRKDGSEFDAGITVSWVIGADGKSTGAVALLRDISEETSLQSQKDRFIANASHELRTPLTNIKLRLYLLGKQPERQADHIRVIESVTENMRDLVEDLLDVSRFDRGIITLERESLVLQDLVREVINVQSSESDHKSVQLTCNLPDEPIVASVDPRRMRQVLTNLIMNGVHYTPSGGTVNVTLERQGSGETADAILCVSDTGIGVAAETLPRLFEPFFRASEGGATGTGLGLTISREIVELHGGTISVESEFGKGSTFSVCLPLDESA